MKTVIIPSDFTMKSVEVAELIITSSHEQTRLIFTHLFHVADDIQDLLFSNYRKREYDFVSKEFYKECNLLKNLHPHVFETAQVEFFYGNKLASFKNFLEFHEASFIAYSKSYGVPKISKSSIDALPVILKCGIPVVDVDVLRVQELVDAAHIL